MHCLSSCPQINITFKHESDDGHGLLNGATCWVGWFGWSPWILVTDITKFAKFSVWFTFPKPIHIEMISLPENLPFFFCLLLVSANYCNLWKSTFTISHGTTMLKCNGHCVNRKFNIQQFYVLPTQCIYVFCVDLRNNSHYFPIQH